MTNQIERLKVEPNSNPEWFRLPGEPAKWYSRFEVYLSIGPERSVYIAHLKVREYREANAEGTWQMSAGAYSSWAGAAKTWRWPERAEAWDDHNRSLLMQRNEERRMEEREVRIKMITQQLHNVDIALLAAQLHTLETYQARELLPTLRLLFRDMLDQHRINLEPLTLYRDDRQQLELIPFTSDELAAAAAELINNAGWGLGSLGLPAGVVHKAKGE